MKILDYNGLKKLITEIKDRYVVKETGKGLSVNDFTTEEKNKLSGLFNYTHPDKHPADIITQDQDNRFVSDNQISAWNSKTDDTTANGHINNLTPHVTADDKTRLGNTVLSTVQTLTTGQKGQARTNIDAVGKSVSETISGQWSFDRLPIIPTAGVNKYEVSRTTNVLTSIIGMVNVVPMMYKNGDTTITEFTLQNNGIGTRAFFYCTNLENVNFINTLVIGAKAFYRCEKLKTAILPSVYRLDNEAFYGSGVEHVDIERDVVMSGGVFKQCLSLTTIVFRSATRIDLPDINVFGLTPIANGTGYIYVPDALVDAYKIATNWVIYASQIKGISELP